MSNKPTYAELEKRVMELEQAEFHRNRVEKALRESETRYRSYFDLGLVGMAITSIDRRWMQFNNRLCDILGYPRVELAQKTWADLTHPDDLPASEALFNRILAGEIDTGSMDKRFIQKSGALIHAILSVHCIRKKDGSVRHFVSAVHDITEQKRMQGQLLESERRLNLALAASKQGWFDLDIPTGAVKVSPEYARLIGYEPDEFNTSYQEWIESLHPDDRSHVLKMFCDCVESGESRSIEYRRRNRFNDWVWIRSVGKIIEHDADGTPTRMMGTHVDITGQKLAELSLQHSEERFRLLLKNVVLGIFIIRDSHILYLDPEKGMTSGPYLESFKSNYFNSADVKKIEIFYKEILASGVSKEGLEVKFFPNKKVAGEDNTRWVHCKGSRIEYEGTTAVMIALVDVTRVKEMEKVLQLREKMASLGQVAAGIAHEIRNPLSGINIFLEGIAENFENPENTDDIRMLIKEAQKASGKIEATIKRVLDFVRPNRPHMKETDINLPVREAIDLMSATLRKRDIVIEPDLCDSLPSLFLDSLLIEQVVMNLMNNAADAMKKNEGPKRIQLTTTQIGNDVFLSIADSGIGVPASLRKKIFDPFFTTKADGSGIGLSFCQRVITDHNGTIRLHSSKWGGAEFRIKLPVDKRVLSR